MSQDTEFLKSKIESPTMFSATSNTSFAKNPKIPKRSPLWVLWLTSSKGKKTGVATVCLAIVNIIIFTWYHTSPKNENEDSSIRRSYRTSYNLDATYKLRDLEVYIPNSLSVDYQDIACFSGENSLNKTLFETASEFESRAFNSAEEDYDRSSTLGRLAEHRNSPAKQIGIKANHGSETCQNSGNCYIQCKMTKKQKRQAIIDSDQDAGKIVYRGCDLPEKQKDHVIFRTSGLPYGNFFDAELCAKAAIYDYEESLFSFLVIGVTFAIWVVVVVFLNISAKEIELDEVKDRRMS